LLAGFRVRQMTMYPNTASVAKRAGAMSVSSTPVENRAGDAIVEVSTWTRDVPLVSSVCSELMLIGGPDTGLP